MIYNKTLQLVKKFQGGEKSIASYKTNFEKRISDPNRKHITNPDGSISTHKMISFEADGKYFAAPTIVEIDGKLIELNSDDAIDYAFKNNEYKIFPSDSLAKAYAEGGYKKGTNMLD